MSHQDEYDDKLNKAQALLRLIERDPLAQARSRAFIEALEETLRIEEETQKWLRDKTL